jgi:alpha-tubulin suppressor-like RCC1 family protein
MKLNSYLPLYISINSKWLKGLTAKAKWWNFQEKSKEKNLHDLRLTMHHWIQCQRNEQLWEAGKLTVIKFKIILKVKRQPAEMEKMFVNIFLIRDFYSEYIKNL